MVTCLLLGYAPMVCCLHAVSARAEPVLTFEQQVRPILKAHCFSCHGDAGQRKGGLDLRLRRLLVAGGESGPVIVPGDRQASELFGRIREGVMPPGEVKLKAEEIERIGRWIDLGAPTARPEPATIGPGYQFTEEERSFWAFRPLGPVAVPAVSNRQRICTPIDAFLLARLEPAGLSFAPEANKRVLLRRVCFDLLGLPPTPAQVDRFLADQADGAYARLIDRLLESPHYGERWGRHWLDAAGYADSEGYTAEDPLRGSAYKYRDYVIRSLNADKPLDRFIQEQLAGDEMVEPPYKNLTAAQIELLTATGFLRMAADGTGTGGVDQALARNQVMADTLQIVGSALLGLTVGCAQCHDHRYDPIPQADYYRLRAIFEPAYDWKNWRNPNQRRVSLSTPADRAEMRRIEGLAVALDKQRLAKQKQFIERTLKRELEKIEPALRPRIRQALATPVARRLPAQQKLLREYPATNVSAGSLYLYDRKAADALKKMAAEAQAIRAKKPAEAYLRCLTEIPGRVPETRIFIRGDYQQPGSLVRPAGLAILAAHSQAPIRANNPVLATTGRRLAYARCLTSGHHPLVARVLVNRIWMHHFGHGLVATPDDFGALGARPTHPKLLDWLAGDLVQGGWRMKRLHKRMMLSAAYRQRSVSDQPAAGTAADPENKLYWHMPMRRLEAEAIRDAILQVSGKLNSEMFGKPVPVRKDEVGQVVVGVDTTDSAGRPTGKLVALHGQEFRRSVYVTVRRSQPLAVLDAFDAPIMTPNCVRRRPSTVTPQALLLLNSQFIRTMAGHFAHRVQREADSETTAEAQRAWSLAYGQPMSAKQRRAAVEFLEALTSHERTLQSAKVAQAGKGAKQKQNHVSDPGEPMFHALQSFCQALLSSNRFLYVE